MCQNWIVSEFFKKLSNIWRVCQKTDRPGNNHTSHRTDSVVLSHILRPKTKRQDKTRDGLFPAQQMCWTACASIPEYKGHRTIHSSNSKVLCKLRRRQRVFPGATRRRIIIPHNVPAPIRSLPVPFTANGHVVVIRRLVPNIGLGYRRIPMGKKDRERHLSQFHTAR